MNTKLNNTWQVWYHHEKDNWKISGFRNIFKIETIKDYWKLFNNWDKLGGINSKNFFIMKENIKPIWEDENNMKGGCWSYKINNHQTNELWNDLSLYLITNQLSKIKDDILGISICLKKKNNSVIKIWNKSNQNNSISLLNNDLLKKWGFNIIYISHMPNIN